MLKNSKRILALIALLGAGLSAPAVAQEVIDVGTDASRRTGRPMFGAEFEFAGQGNRIPKFENQSFENYRKLMEVIVKHYGGNASQINKVEWKVPHPTIEGQERTLFRAEWKDAKGNKWKIEPEYVATKGLDGYELVTPPLADAKDMAEILNKIKASGIVREGLKSGVHVHVDGKRLIAQNGNATGLINLINMHENYEPLLRRLFNPVRGEGYKNYFAQPLYATHSELLAEISNLPPEKRTQAELERIFQKHIPKEMKAHGITELNAEGWKKLWKYNNLNLKNVLNINELLPAEIGTVEFRMNDLSSGKTHQLQIELYRKMVERAAELAAQGKVVKYGRGADFKLPAGVDPAILLTPEAPAEAKAQIREMLTNLGLDPVEFERLIEKNIQPKHTYSEKEFKERVERLERGPVELGGKNATFGFELEGRGSGVTAFSRPTDAAVEARWDRMSKAEKVAYYNEVVGERHSEVRSRFKVDMQRFPYLDGTMKIEGSGNWEIRSNVFESIGEATDKMREIKELTKGSGKGFHLHMRHNNPNMEVMTAKGQKFADFIERASYWVFFERVNRLRSDVSLKSWSNTPMTPQTLSGIARMQPSNHARHTIRVQKNLQSANNLDIEIRGFTLDVNKIETLGKLMTEALRTNNFGPWKFSENILPHSGQGAEPKETRLLPFVEEYLKSVEGRTLTPEQRIIVESLQKRFPDLSGKRTRALSSNLGVPLQPWDKEVALEESQRRTMKFERQEYLRRISNLAMAIEAGKYGTDVNFASKQELMEKLGVSEKTANEIIKARRAGNGFNDLKDFTRKLATAALPGTGNVETVNARTTAGQLQATGISTADANLLIKTRAQVKRRFNGELTTELNLQRATASEISERLGLTKAEAQRFTELRGLNTNFSDINSLMKEMAKKANPHTRLAAVSSYNQLSLEELKRIGMNAQTAKRVIGAQETLQTKFEGKLGNLEYYKIEGQTRKHVKTWVADSKIAEAMQNTLLPKAETGPRGEGFANRRTVGTQGELKISTSEVKLVFESMRETVATEIAKTQGLNPENVRNAKLEIVSGKQLVMEYVKGTNTIRVSEATLNEIHNRSKTLPAEQRVFFRRKALGVMLGHELAHSGGIKAESVADRTAIEALKKTQGVGKIGGVELPITKQEIKETLRVFERPTGSKAINNIMYRLRQLPKYGFETGRATNMASASVGGGDPYKEFRRADGTLNLGKMTAKGVLGQGTGTAHFALALFLKELAVVIQTGDRLRIEEFFETLKTVDFFVHYGLFVVGAQAGNIAYARTIEKFIKPRFVNGILKTNLVLATGMALPEIVYGTFEGKAFAINLTGLGLSSAAVKGTIGSIKWVTNLKRADNAGKLVRTATSFRRFAKLGGWFYTAAETAVVLYFGEEISKGINNFLDERAARQEVANATERFFKAVNDENLSEEDFREAVHKFDETHVNYRNFLYRALQEDEGIKDMRLGKIAQEAQRRESELETMKKQLESNPAILDKILSAAAKRAGRSEAYANVDEYLADRRGETEKELSAKMDEVLAAYEKARSEKLVAIYNEDRRDSKYLDHKNADWLAGGLEAGSSGDPYNGKSDYYSRFMRDRAKSSVLGAASKISSNRIQAYDDQMAVVRLAMANASESRKAYLASLQENLETIKEKDEDLIKIEMGKEDADTKGATSAISGATGGN